MRVCAAILLVTAAGATAAGADWSRAVRDLSSPFADERDRAVADLAGGGPEAAAALRAAYPAADFAVREAILEAFGRGMPAQGVDVLLSDLSSTDRGVINAGRRLVSALYLSARDAVLSALPALGPDGSWEREERLRSLPGPAPSARRALAELLASPDPRLASAGRLVADRVAEVDGLRAGLARARRDGDGRAAEGAREMERLLARHDAERALRAVLEAGGMAGSYDGMYSLVGEVRDVSGPGVRDALLGIVVGRSPAEAGVKGPRDGAALLETTVLDALDIRERAAACLGEVGDPTAAEELLAYFEKIREQRPDRYDDTRWPIALACAALSAREPLETMIREYSREAEELDGIDLGRDHRPLRFMMTGWIHEDLATAHTRLGELVEAHRHLRAALSDQEGPVVRFYNFACLLSRMGRLEEALSALRSAIEGGYALDPSNVRWMERDRDLKALRDTPGYAALLADVRAGRYSTPR